MAEIIGYEGLYEWDGENVIGLKRGKVLKWRYNSNGRPFVDLCKDGKHTNFYKHMLVWMSAHNQVIHSGCEIHHIDGDFTNNTVENLQLLTREEHQRIHGDKQSKAVNCFKDGKLIATYPSTREASRQLKLNQGGISMVTNGKQKTYGGYTFSWASEHQSEADGQLYFNFA